MKPLTDTLITLINEHSIDILQHEQRLKAMLADLLPHDKQMRFLLELSLRAQIPQKLIAQQNETRLGWEAQIKSLKHYFKDEYFIEDKAVESVFDCWVEVFPRKRQKAVAPKLGNLNAKSKIKNIDPITWHNWHKFAFKQNSNWQPFFEKSKITNYQSFFKDIGIIKNSNNTGSYPKLLLPLSLQNEVEKQPPLELPEKLRYFQTRFQHTKEDFEIINRLSNQKSYKELNDYCEKRGINDFDKKKRKEKEVYEKREQERNNILNINADKTKTFSLEQFIKFGSVLGLELDQPVEPINPNKPKKSTIETTFEKDASSITINAVFVLSAVISTIIFAFIEKNDGLEWFLLIYAIFVFFAFVVFAVDSVFKENFWVAKYQKTLSYSKEEIEKRDKTEQVYYEERLTYYNNVLLPSYNDEFTKYKNKISQQEKDLNEAFPLIARQMWLHAMYSNYINFNSGTPKETSVGIQKLVARLALLYPQILKVGLKFPDSLQTAILLHINNRVIINIEVDEPYNRVTRQETNFIGSDSEKRDIICSEKNLFVLRFTESQVTYALSECVSIVQELVMFTQSANTQHLLNIREVSKSIEVLCWTKEVARLMAMYEE